MLSIALGTGALAVACWPMSGSAARLRRIVPRAVSPRWRPAAPGFGLAVGSIGLLGLLCCGVGVALACVLAAVTFRWRRRARRREHRVLAGTTEFGRALRAMVAELRAGAHPAVAADGVASESSGPTAEVLTAIATTSRLGGDVPRTLAEHADRAPALRPVLDQLGNAWALVTRYGLPLAEVLDATRADLEHRARFAKQVAARMAGPRSAAAVLAGLPVLGVALGEAMGVHPLRILAFTPVGQVLTVLGTALACAGIAWSARLIERTALR